MEGSKSEVIELVMNRKKVFTSLWIEKKENVENKESSPVNVKLM